MPYTSTMHPNLYTSCESKSTSKAPYERNTCPAPVESVVLLLHLQGGTLQISQFDMNPENGGFSTASQPFIPGVSERTMVGTTSKGGTSAFKGIGKKGGGTHVHTCPPTQKKNNWRNKKSLTFERKLLLPAIFGVHVGIQGCRWIPQSLHILRPYDSWSEILKQLVLYVNININIKRDNHIPTS